LRTPAGQFVFDDLFDGQSGLPSTKVVVTRTSATTWLITAHPDLTGGAGDVAVMWEPVGNQNVIKGYYHLPFQISVSYK
jgi:hypothetical protein